MIEKMQAQTVIDRIQCILASRTIHAQIQESSMDGARKRPHDAIGDNEELSDIERLRQENARLRQENEALIQRNSEIEQQHAADRSTLNDIEQELENLSNEANCGICMNRPENDILLVCGHNFCGDCISSWTATKIAQNAVVTCPQCRQNPGEIGSFHHRQYQQMVEMLVNMDARKIQTETRADGSVYTGQLRRGLLQGRGKMVYANQDVYDGNWDEDKRQGHGVMTYANGNTYDGNWNQDKREGYGKETDAEGNTYEGMWLKDRKHGKGVWKEGNGNMYEGDFEYGWRHGQGKMTWTDKEFHGMWESGNYYDGTMTFANGEVYQGTFKNGKKHGQGHIKYANGEQYEGEWFQNSRSGHGQMRYQNGDVYEGEWKADSFSEGCYEYNNGDVYRGEWYFAKKQGEGVMEYANGDMYDGQWYEGKRNGNGEYSWSDNSFYKGQWNNNQIDRTDGKYGEYTLNDGRVYKGRWKNNKIDGQIVTIPDLQENNPASSFCTAYPCQYGYIVTLV